MTLSHWKTDKNFLNKSFYLECDNDLVYDKKKLSICIFKFLSRLIVRFVYRLLNGQTLTKSDKSFITSKLYEL